MADTGSLVRNLNEEDAMKVLAAVIALAFGCLTAMPAAAQQITSVGSTSVYPVLVRWALENGQGLTGSLGYVPLPPSLVQQIEAYWEVQIH